jgi:GNAT superfamily N-acetyltransferase
VIVRPARPDEAEALARLATVTLRAAFERDIPAVHLEPYLASSFTAANAVAELSDPRVRLLVAEDAGELGGYAKLQLGPAPDAVHAVSPIELVRMYLLPAWYGRGAGNELMTRSLGEARSLACDALWLKVWDRNERARRFYARWDLREIGTTSLALVPGVAESTLGMRIMARPAG